MIFREIKNISQNIEGMQALLAITFLAGTFQLITNGYFEFSAMDIFQNKTGSSGDAHDIILLFAEEQVFYLLDLELDVLLCHGFGHFELVYFIYLLLSCYIIQFTYSKTLSTLLKIIFRRF